MVYNFPPVFDGETATNNEQRCFAVPDDVLEQAPGQPKNGNGSSRIVSFASEAGEEPIVARSPRRAPSEVSIKTPGA